jgi:hypothetical protein
LRYHRTFGLDTGQLDELEARIEDILPDPWDKGIGRPKSLSLREAIMVTLLYERQNMIEEVIADLFGVSQGTVSEIITEFTPLIAQATEEFRPDAEEAKQITRGRLALVDGTLWESAGINRHGGGDGRALRRRASDPRRPRVMRRRPARAWRSVDRGTRRPGY